MVFASVCWKVQIQPAISSESTDGYIICMCKAFKKTKVIWRYVEALALHTVAPTVHWEDNTSCIYGVFHKKNWQLVSRNGHFCHFRGLLLCNAKRLQFHSYKKLRRKGTVQKVFNALMLSFFLIWVVVASVCVAQKIPCCNGSIIIFDGFWITNIFYKN